MIEGLIGRKIGMTQSFDAEGNSIPVTVLKAGPCAVVQKKGREKNGYSAIQLGLVDEKRAKKQNKPLAGHFKKAGFPVLRALREFQSVDKAGFKEGDQVFVDIFQVGDRVHVTGMSKGKGFQGVVKRWGFRGGRASHGSMFHRAPGSIGASSFPSRVTKGKKMAGHMGHARMTVRNLTVIGTDKENNLLLIKGAIPGPRGGYVVIKKDKFGIR